MKTVKSQILSFLQQNPGTHHGGQIQRMDFKTNKGGNATGDCIKRRCNDLVKEGLVFVSYNTKHEALFSAEFKSKMRQQVSFRENADGSRVAVIDLIPVHG